VYSGPVNGRTVTKRRERHHLALVAAHIEPLDVLRRGADRGIGLHERLPLPAERLKSFTYDPGVWSAAMTERGFALNVPYCC